MFFLLISFFNRFQTRGPWALMLSWPVWSSCKDKICWDMIQLPVCDIVSINRITNMVQTVEILVQFSPLCSVSEIWPNFLFGPCDFLFWLFGHIWHKKVNYNPESPKFGLFCSVQIQQHWQVSSQYMRLHFWDTIQFSVWAMSLPVWVFGHIQH